MILPHSIGIGYPVDMGKSLSESNNSSNSNEYPSNLNDEIIRSSYAEIDRFSQDCSGRENIEEICVDLSSTLSRALSQIPDIGSNTKGAFKAIGMYIDRWRETISTTINCQAEKSARDQAIIASTNEEMIAMRASLAEIQAKIQANGNKVIKTQIISTY